MQRIAIIDYGMGNLRSVSKALETVSENTVIDVTADPEKILCASHVVFPGVGAIRDCIAELDRLQLNDVVLKAATNKPFLGVCLGMQALLNHSEESGGINTLGLIEGNVQLFKKMTDKNGERLKVPHMGWNRVHQTVNHPLWQNIDQDSRFYFVHSYYVKPVNQQITAAETEYPEKFTSAIFKDNVFAVQFHPEKSQHAGLQLLKNFLSWDGVS